MTSRFIGEVCEVKELQKGRKGEVEKRGGGNGSEMELLTSPQVSCSARAPGIS